MRNIAIIPARSGSKGLKDKNIKLLNGKPLIWYSIQAARNSRCFDEVMVSTDSILYAEIARDCGATVPFLRSKANSGDKASSWGTVKEVLLEYKKKNELFDNVMLLQPTSPLRTSEDIIASFRLMKEKSANSVVGMCEVDHSPLLSNTLPEDGNLCSFIRPEVVNSCGRQELPTFYRINGAIYLTKVNYEDLKFNIYNEHGYAYVMPRNRSVDIDDALDFLIAEQILINTRKIA